MKTFSELPLSTQLQNNLQKHGFTEPTPVQAQTIEPALSGRDMVVTAQTGTGKTLAFVLPIIDRIVNMPDNGSASKVRAVIMTPTRELAMQIEVVFAKMAAGSGVRAAVAVGGLGEQPQLKSIRKGAQVLIATPGRLQDFLNRKLVDLGGVRTLVLDEADRMLDMGFLPAIKSLMAAMPASRQTLFFSATIESSVKHLVGAHVNNAVRVEVGPIGKPIDQVDLHLYEVEQDAKLGLLSTMLRQEQGSFLVFARTKRGADRLSSKLLREGVTTAAIHGDRSQGQRTKALQGFQAGQYRVLVATDVAARGIHVDGISHVVNFDLPQLPEDFIHRVGRTGRAGARGTASTFATRSQRGEVANIEKTLDTRLVRRHASSDVSADQGAPPPVIVIPDFAPKPRQVRSFSPRGGVGNRRSHRAG